MKHEETLATSSFAGTYLVVLDMEEAQIVATTSWARATVTPSCSASRLPAPLALTRTVICHAWAWPTRPRCSKGNRRDRTPIRTHDAEQVRPELNDHFVAFNTICDTQERQDAMFSLVDELLDLMVVIGGFNSSNTTHLQEIAVSRGIRSFHIDTPDRLDAQANAIEHKPLNENLRRESNFLPAGPVTVGITSGASTPDRAVEEVIEKLMLLSES